jgi:hypothetical protein
MTDTCKYKFVAAYEELFLGKSWNTPQLHFEKWLKFDGYERAACA